MADKTASTGQSGADALKKLGTSSQKSGKKLPKRIKNTKRKEQRKASWMRGQERKEARRKAQAERERINREHRSRGELTPAEQAYRQRRNRRRALAHITANGCRTTDCQRPKAHKGKHGEPTKTEMAAALQAVTSGS